MRTANVRVFLAMCVFAGAYGCIPFASPPFDMALGATTHKLRTSDATADGAWGNQGFYAQLAVAPLRVVPVLASRRYDVRFGGFADTEADNGAFVEGGVRLWRGVWKGSGHSKRGTPAWLTASVAGESLGLPLRDNWGMRATVTFEFVDFVRGQVRLADEDQPSPGDVWGFGEAGSGLFVQSSYHHRPRETYWTLAGGLTLTFPALAGFLWLNSR